MRPTTATRHPETGLHGRRVLVTGGAGFLGSSLAHACTVAGATVTTFDNLSPQAGGNERNLDGVPGRQLRGDLRDAAALREAVEGQEIVFHCAALTSHNRSLQDPLGFAEANAQGTLLLLEAVRRGADGARVVYLGTTTQAGRMLREPMDETHPEFPLDVYSATKCAGEKYALLYHAAHGLRTTSVRLGNVYGPRACIRSADFGFLNYFIGLALQGKPITVYGTGAQRRGPLYVDDAVEALLAALAPAAEGQAFFAAAQQQATVAELAAAIVRNIGGSLQHVDWPADRARIDVGDAAVSNRKIRDTLGWASRTGLDDGLRRTAAFYRPRLAHYLAHVPG